MDFNILKSRQLFESLFISISIENFNVVSLVLYATGMIGRNHDLVNLWSFVFAVMMMNQSMIGN